FFHIGFKNSYGIPPPKLPNQIFCKTFGVRVWNSCWLQLVYSTCAFLLPPQPAPPIYCPNPGYGIFRGQKRLPKAQRGVYATRSLANTKTRAQFPCRCLQKKFLPRTRLFLWFFLISYKLPN